MLVQQTLFEQDIVIYLLVKSRWQHDKKVYQRKWEGGMWQWYLQRKKMKTDEENTLKKKKGRKKMVHLMNILSPDVNEKCK